MMVRGGGERETAKRQLFRIGGATVLPAIPETAQAPGLQEMPPCRFAAAAFLHRGWPFGIIAMTPSPNQGTRIMAKPEDSPEDVFYPSGKLRLDVIDESAGGALQESVRLAHDTRWDSIRSPHIFMGLLAAPAPGVDNWGKRLGADLPKLLEQFRELFRQDEGDANAVLLLTREFLSDNVIRLLRDALNRAVEHQRKRITAMDLLISILTAPNSIVAECFERIGVTAAKLTELAVMAEQAGPRDADNPPGWPNPSNPTPDK
jgi:hypothetical protein